MANGNTSPSRLGVKNAASDGAVNDLFLKVFSGEILTTFEESTVMKELHTIRTISNGKSAQFPVTGTATAKYHTAGESIVDAGNSYLSSIKHNERIISIDDMLISSTFISNIDELKNHYDVRSIYAKELGKALAYRFDEATLKTLIAASYADASYTGGPAGQQGTQALVDANSALNAANIVKALFEAAEMLDGADVPSDGRFAVVTPAVYYTLLTADNTAINKDTVNAGNADVATGVIMNVAGIKLVKSNRLAAITKLTTSQNAGDVAGGGNADDAAGVNNNPWDVAAAGDEGDGYNKTGGLTTKMVVGHPSAIGTVKLLDLATESEYQIERQGTLFVAKYAMGHGILRPECSIAYD